MWLYASVISNLGTELKNPDLQVSFQITNIFGLISQAIGWSLIIGALILFMCIIIYGVQWINSGGDTNSVSSAKTKITNCLFGFAVLSLTYTITLLVQYFLGISVFQTPGSVFTPPTLPPVANFVPTPTPTTAPLACKTPGLTCVISADCCTPLVCNSGICGGPVIVPPTPTPPPAPIPTPTPINPSAAIDLNGTNTISVAVTYRIFGISVQPSSPTPFIHTYITNSGGNIVFQKNTQTLSGGIYEFSIDPSSLGVGDYTWHTYFCNDYSTWCSDPILIKQVPLEIVP